MGLLIAAVILAAVPAAFAAAPSGFPFRPDPQPEAAPPAPPDGATPAGLDVKPDVPDPEAGLPAPGNRPAHLEPSGPLVGPPVAPPADRPDVPNEIKARCVGSIRDTGEASVECGWVAREGLDVSAWQLWKQQVRPEHGDRVLVAELRPDTTNYVDTDVEVPAHYAYVVLGVDSTGEVIARSAPAPVQLVDPPAHDRPLRLKCRPLIAIDGIDPAVTPSPSIGCEWSPTDNETAVGYVLWRMVDGGDRQAIARTGLDTLRHVDTGITLGQRITYVVTAVDSSGEVVARSREEHVGIPGPHPRPLPPIHILPEPGRGPVVPEPPKPVGPMNPPRPVPMDPPSVGTHQPQATAPQSPANSDAGTVAPPATTTTTATVTTTTAKPASPRTSASG